MWCCCPHGFLLFLMGGLGCSWRGPSTCAKLFQTVFLLPLKASVGLLQAHFCSWSQDRSFQLGGLQVQFVPHSSSPQAAHELSNCILCPYILVLCYPTSLCCLVQPCYGHSQFPPPAWIHNLMLHSVSPQGCTHQGRSPKKLMKEKFEVLPLGRDKSRHQHMHQAAWLVSSQRKATTLLPSCYDPIIRAASA